ncbi:MAG: methyltransferase domain-containing protein [Verrucomicrobiaceae bacterium]|nr:methyltransferase domain-containing protein [Verrucomicrobiaceae bacterium]
MEMKDQCPGCSCASLTEPWVLPAQPVVLNYRFPSVASAAAVRRVDMHLTECPECGLIFNASLDETAIPYDEHYDNRQSFSPAFEAMLRDTADTLDRHHRLRDGTILEVGCGKGDFLRMICGRTGAKGIGYDTSCEHDGLDETGRVRFFKRYVSAADVSKSLKLVLCRHVVEHVPSIGAFFQLLHDIAVAGGGAPVYVETPAWEWIVRHEAFWDVFYEHCNYFPLRTLRTLAERAGFSVLDHRLVFGGQYQALELNPRSVNESAPLVAGAALGPSLKSFAESIDRSRRAVEIRLARAGADLGWALWGAGAKGVSLANTLTACPPACVVDANPDKQGHYLAGTGIPVVSPQDQRLEKLPVVLVANPNYLTEVGETLASRGLSPQLLTI